LFKIHVHLLAFTDLNCGSIEHLEELLKRFGIIACQKISVVDSCRIHIEFQKIGVINMSSGISIHPCAPQHEAAVEALSGLPASVISDVMGRSVGTTGLNLINRTPMTVCGVAVTVQVRAGDNLLILVSLSTFSPRFSLFLFLDSCVLERYLIEVLYSKRF
jgi:hypothetical protein